MISLHYGKMNKRVETVVIDRHSMISMDHAPDHTLWSILYDYEQIQEKLLSSHRQSVIGPMMIAC